MTRVVAPGLDAEATLVRDVMTPQLVAIEPTTSVSDALRIVTRRRCRHLLVIDDGRLCGLVSAGDLAAWLIREQEVTIDDLYLYITR
jgi:CBS domain-containing protein